VTATAGNTPVLSSQANRGSTTMAFGCMLAFLTPFAAAGVGLTLAGISRLAQGNWHDGLGLCWGGVIFGGAAVALGTVGWAGRYKLRDQEKLQTTHPERPWLWRPDWASGRIADSNRRALWTSCGFAVFWNLIAFPCGYLGILAVREQGKPGGYVALIFPLVGVILLAWAVRSTIRYRKYGFSQLELSTIPAVIAHSLVGTVRVGAAISPPEGFLVTLSCVRRVTSGSGKSRSTTETILWQDDQRAAGTTTRDAAGWGTLVPAAFRIPADAEPCQSENPDNQVLWRLGATASVAGVDYGSVFEVPVFRTEASATPPTDAEAQLAQRHTQEISNYRQPPTSRIRVSRAQAGVEIFFPAARNPGVASGITGFTLIWGAIAWALLHYRAPLVFPIVFGLSDLLLGWVSLELWLGVTRATVRSGVLLLAKGLGYPAREQQLSVESIADVVTAIGMQAGSTPYYDVIVCRKDGQKVIAGHSVRDKREAEWLAITLKKELGLPTTQ
jgi:hypothetical protein